MGWTHYWKREVEIPAAEFKKASVDCKKVIELLDVSIAGEEGSGPPVYTDEEVIFNGIVGADCEPFVFRRVQPPRPGRDIVRGYCKTEHLPYDLAVQCCLVVFNHHFGDLIEISTDGSEENWQEAFDICKKECGCQEIHFKT